MSTIGTSVAQSVAGADQAGKAAGSGPAKRAKEAERRDVKKADVVEIVAPSPEALDAAKAGENEGEQRRKREEQLRQQAGQGEGKPSLDVQG